MKNCEYYEELIGAAIDGEITAEEDKELRAHLESCGTCRSFYEAMQAISGADNALGEPPEDFTANVMALVHKAAAPQEKAPAKKKTNITRLVTRYGALAAVAAAAIWAGTAFFGAKGSSGAAPETAMFSMPAPVTEETAVCDEAADAAPAEAAPRSMTAAAPDTGAQEQLTTLRYGSLEIQPERYSVRLGSQAIACTPREVELLYLLASHPGRVFDREQILSRIWGYDFFGDTRTVDTHIKRLRQKLACEEMGKTWDIITVYGVGYKFEADT